MDALVGPFKTQSPLQLVCSPPEIREHCWGQTCVLFVAETSLPEHPLAYFLFSKLKHSLSKYKISLNVYEVMQIIAFIMFKCVCLTGL